MRQVVVVLLLCLLFSLAVSGQTFEVFQTGENVIAHFNNLTGQLVDALRLEFATPTIPIHALGIGGDMNLIESEGALLVYEGLIEANGVWEIEWPHMTRITSATWLYQGVVIEHIDVHQPTARMLVRYLDLPLTVEFRALNCSDPDGAELVDYMWEFSDGVVLQGHLVRRTFSDVGEFEVVLTVTDIEGLRASAKRKLRVPRRQLPGQSLGRQPIIVFAMQDDEGWYQIWTVKADGSDLVQITTDSTHHFYPKWSPDGTRIAFLSTPNDNLNTDVSLRIVGSDGTGQRMVTEVTSGRFCWSRAGDLAITRYAKAPQHGIFRIDPDTGTSTALVLGDYANVKISPDGKWLSTDGPGHELWIGNSDGTDLRRVRIPYVSPRSATGTWSPDGTKLAVVSDLREVLLVDPFSLATETVFVPQDLGSPYIYVNGPVNWSGDSTRLSFAVDGPGVDSTPVTLDLGSGDANLHPDFDGPRVSYGWVPDEDTFLVTRFLDPSIYLETYSVDTDSVRTVVEVPSGRSTWFWPEWQGELDE